MVDGAGGQIGLNSLCWIGIGGHNNIEINLVFRGMVRPKDELLTKGKL
jgi:hypothetical protein